MPRAPLLSEAAAESFGHAVPCMLQALQAAHSGLSMSAMLLHDAVGQHGLQSSWAWAEIRPLLEIDTPGIAMLLLQAVAAALLGMQVPSGPLQNSQAVIFMPLRAGTMAEQVSWVQVASNVTVSPAQPLHVHVVSAAVGLGDEVST